MIRDRRGVAMLAAMWLILGISIVALQFALSGKERRVLALAAADRGRDAASHLPHSPTCRRSSTRLREVRRRATPRSR